MTRPAPIIAGTLAALVLLFGAYMGAYYAMLNGIDVLSDDPLVVIPTYRWDSVDGFLQSPPSKRDDFFLPAHQLDRLIRPGHWGDK